MSITSASICEAADQLQGFVGFNARTGQHIVRFSEDSEGVDKRLRPRYLLHAAMPL